MENNEKKFSWQTCQDEELNKKFYDLHKVLVNQIVRFCMDNNLDIDEVHLSADGLRSSIPHGEWTAGSDSSMVMYLFDEKQPYTQRAFDCEPFLCSM